jgi:uncharacterized FAD-dependent dehydrogenase
MYDVVIIGGGIGGLMTAHRLVTTNKELKVAIIEQGKELSKRVCPMTLDHGSCRHCSTCAITHGIAGAGAFSDGKFNMGTAYGGTLGEELGEELTMTYIDQLDEILLQYATDYPDIYVSDTLLKLKCLQNNLTLLDMNVRHLGTDKNYDTMLALYNDLKDTYGVEMMTGTTCIDLYKPGKKAKFQLIVEQGNHQFFVDATTVVVATGRSGANFVKKLCKEFEVEVEANAVDICVRVEMPDLIWREFSEKIYEPKIHYRTPTFGDNCRMFCFNQGGIVSAENNHGIITANGHSYADKSKKTQNCNFAVLSSAHFTEPFNQPTEYAESIARMANMIGAGNVIVQRLGDLKQGRRTTQHRLDQGTTRPTLKATPGDLSLVLPHRVLTNIIETLDALDKVAPGTANPDTLLYGVESKYYSLKPKHNKNFELIPGLYLIGDGSGICRGLSQSGAMGLYVADCITKEFK